jgi:hypothetical protein
VTADLDTPAFGRPGSDEHAPYYGRYIDRVADGDIVDLLQQQERDFVAFLVGIPAEKHDHRYADGKWSVKEVLGHLTDAERIFAYRALRFARADQTPLSGFDENLYVPAANFGGRDFGSLVDEWLNVRRATLSLLRGLNAEAAERRGKANDQEISVRALAYVIAGHTDHHQAILDERYLASS